MAIQITDELKQIKQDFKEWIISEKAQQDLDKIAQEVIEVRELLSKLEKMDHSSDEFTHNVLYGLLPYYETQYALRTSRFPVFMNFKQWFSEYNYTDEDYKKIAELIYTVSIKVRDNPEKIQTWLNEFNLNPLSKGLQCGSITPIIFCLNNDLPLINGQVEKTYAYFYKFFNHGKISTKLKNYQNSSKKLRIFRSNLNIQEIDDWVKMDLFCYWFHTLRNKKPRYAQAPKNHTKYIEKINPEKTKHFINQYKPKPNSTTISEILKKSQENKWVLPYFQRYFTWTRADVRDFLTSIFNDYYVGSFLFWEIYSESIPLGTISIKGINTNIDERKVESIIIDGQQRITSLYYAIKTPNFPLRGSRKTSYFYLDLEKYFKTISAFKDESDRWDIIEIMEVKTKKMKRKESFEKMVFPIYELETRAEWIKEFQNFLLEKTQNQLKVYEIIFFLKEKLDNIYHTYSIPYISLPDTVKIYEVTNIFENINSKGRPLSTFDLLIARILRHKINLRDIWDETLEKYTKIAEYFKYTDSIPIYILQTIALTYTNSKSCKKKDLLNLAEKANLTTEDNFKQIWFSICDTFKETIKQLENLRDGFGVRSYKEVPFMSMLPVLTALNHEIKENQQKKASCNQKMNQFYWSAVFTNAYSASVESQLTLDYREMLTWFNDGKVPSTIKNAQEQIDRIDLRNVSQKSSARYRGVLSLVALHGAKDFESGKMLEAARSNDQHHIFPKDIYKEHKHVDSVLNISWLSSSTNRRIGKIKPSNYYYDFATKKYTSEEEFIQILSTHYITDKQLAALKNDEFEQFHTERNKAILDIIKQKIGLASDQSSSQILLPSEPYTNITKLKNTIQNCREYIVWIDKYFSSTAFEIILESIDPYIQEIKILTSIDKTTEKLRSDFIRFRNELKNKGILADMRVMTDSNLKRSIHDRWIIASNVSYNVPSVDSVMRGQYSEITQTQSNVPYLNWWDNSSDIIQDWNNIKDNLP